MTYTPHDPHSGWPPEQQHAPAQPYPQQYLQHAQDPAPYPAAPAHPAARPTNRLAVASMVVSLVGLVVCCGSVSGIVGAVLGHVARGRIRQTGEAGAGMALTGVLVGWIGFAIFLVAFTLHLLFNVLVVEIPGL